MQLRGGLVESVHYGSLIALDSAGRTLLSAGDPLALYYPRSSIKPLQAVAMVRAGLVLPPKLLALAAASHSGSPQHVLGARQILALHGLDEEALGNTPDLPFGVQEKEAWLRSGGGPTRLTQNCSGKHAAMAATCVINDWQVDGYWDPGHPLQQLIRRVVEELTAEQIRHASTDGCGTPVFALSLRAMATAFSRLTTSRAGTAEAEVAAAMTAHPERVAGQGRDVTDLMRRVPGLLAKDGFEGIQLAALADGRAVAVKISDGGDRARMPVTAHALIQLGVDPASLSSLAFAPVLGGGNAVGELQPIPLNDRPQRKSMPASELRLEHDLLGDREIPRDAYWGVHTLRAVENFPITGQKLSSNTHLVRGLAMVKMAAATANCELGLLDDARAAAIVQACQDILDGELHAQFVVDVIQGGAGTSSNMNANEVIANRALEVLGHHKGEYQFLHPIDHVNLSQSTNDVYPTAVNVATIFAVRELLAALKTLADAFADKATEFRTVVKMGRTQLQDAVPMTLGQEFDTYAVTIGEDRERLAEASLLIHEINLGATAIGTGLNAPVGYAALACRHLAEITQLPLVTAFDLIEATQDVGAFVHLSGVLKRVAVKLSKICNDLRLLSSGPRSGFDEINLPAVQSGSSIMPGKVNPVIPEVVNQVAYEVIGNDVTITMAAEGGQLQLNAFEPIIVHSLTKSISHLQAACLTLTERCVRGITANEDKLRLDVEQSIGLVTALNPHIGYAAATAIALEAQATGRGVAELVLEQRLLTLEQLDELLRPERLANLTT